MSASSEQVAGEAEEDALETLSRLQSRFSIELKLQELGSSKNHHTDLTQDRWVSSFRNTKSSSSSNQALLVDGAS